MKKGRWGRCLLGSLVHHAVFSLVFFFIFFLSVFERQTATLDKQAEAVSLDWEVY